MNELAFLVPVLGRPHRVKPLLDSINATTDSVSVYFVPNPEDETEIEAIQEAGGQILCQLAGNYAEKINAAIRLTDEPLIFLGADDLAPRDGWLNAAKAKLSDTIGVVGTQDLCNPRVIRGEHATHCLVARWYVEQGTIDEPGKLLHEGYLHEYVDDEFVGTAKSRGAFAFAHESVVEHLHPMVGKAPMDELYEAQRVRMRHGIRRFRVRSPMWMSQSS